MLLMFELSELGKEQDEGMMGWTRLIPPRHGAWTRPPQLASAKALSWGELQPSIGRRYRTNSLYSTLAPCPSISFRTLDRKGGRGRNPMFV